MTLLNTESEAEHVGCRSGLLHDRIFHLFFKKLWTKLINWHITGKLKAETCESRGAGVGLEGPLRPEHAGYETGGWGSLWVAASIAWQLAHTPLGGRGDGFLQPYASFIYSMENHHLQTCLLILPAAGKGSGSCLRQAFPENVIFWEWEKKSYYVVYKAQNNTEDKQI